MKRLNDPEIVASEYATSERLEARRLDRTAELFGQEPWDVALAALAEVEPRRVLDAGCGTGDFAERIDAPEVVCIDLSPAMVERARARGLNARVADIGALPFRDGEFDCVTCNWVLYHLPDLDRGLSELARVLRPRGRLVAIANSERHLEELWGGAVPDPWGPSGFDCEQAPGVLQRHFAGVERRETRGTAVWRTREALEVYLDAFSELAGPIVAPPGPCPFTATRRNCVLVAEKA